MPSFRQLIDPGRRALAYRLDQLCATLESLSARLRGTIANAVGETIGGVVRDAALRVLDDVMKYLSESASTYVLPKDTYRQEFERAEQDYWGDDLDDATFDPEVQPIPTEPARLPAALASGLQAASWWLQRSWGQQPVWTTIAIGLTATGIAFIGGPLAVALLGLAGSATQFTTLSAALGKGASVFGLFESY